MYCSYKGKIRGIDSIVSNDPNSGYETALRRRGQGEVLPFLQLFKQGSSVESANSARGKPSNGAFRYFGWERRDEESSLKEEEENEEEEERRPYTRV